MSTQYDPLPRTSFDFEEQEFKDKPLPRRYYKLIALPLALFKKSRRACRPIYIIIVLITFLLWQITFNGSYTKPPPYSIHSTETVFIAANIIDGELIKGPWGASLLDLVDAIGPTRVHVSIYGGPTEALNHLASLLECAHTIVSEADSPILLHSIPHTTLPTGAQRIKRIAYLAEVRNRALLPLATLSTNFNRILFINDVFFTADDATRLLWGTNTNSDGVAQYKAACAADFVTSWKYYDTYGTRDAEGYSIGVPIFPWFAAEGEAVSRRDVLSGSGAVRVKSCWGGMVSFDARYFQTALKSQTIEPKLGNDGLQPPTLPLRFRSEPDPFWDASECCLIHADIMALPPFADQPEALNSQDGIFMNPFVRVTYDASSYSRIWIVKRFERLFALPQGIINIFVHMPRFNYRRTEKEGDVVKGRVWVSTKDPAAVKTADNRAIGKRATLGTEKSKAFWAAEGHYEDFERTATRGGYCGVRQLLVLKEGNTDNGNWDNLLDQVPPLDV